MQEIWKPVPIAGVETLYEVSNKGRLRSLKKNKKFICTPRIYNGYRKVLLKTGSRIVKTTALHRLVALAFIPNPEKKETVNHKDFNRLNCRVDNLEWLTQKENKAHSVAFGRQAKGEKVNSAKLTAKKVLEIRAQNGLYSTRKLSQKYGVCASSISYILCRKTWKHI